MSNSPADDAPAQEQPLWRDEFSVHTDDEHYVQRRQFVKFLVLASGAMLAGNAWLLVRSQLDREPTFPRALIAQAGDVPVGGVKLFRYPTALDPCILIRPDAATFVAYSQRCTHLSCAVYFSRQSARIECPCHHGAFAARTGAPIQGPPRRPLPRIVLDRVGDALYAVGVDLQTEG